MSFYNMFSTDADLEAGAGIVLDYGEAGRITIHRAGGANKKFVRILEAKLKPYRRQIDTGTLDEGVSRRLTAEAYAEGIVVTWDGVTDADGKPLPFSVAACVKLFLDLPELFSDVIAQANTVGNFRRQQQRDDVGN